MQHLTQLCDALFRTVTAVSLSQVMPTGPLISTANWSEVCLHAVGGFLGGLMCVLRRTRTSQTPWWDDIRRIAMAVVFPATCAGTTMGCVRQVTWTFHAQLTLCAFLGMTAHWIVGWILKFFEQRDGRDILSVFREMNVLQWLAKKILMPSGAKVPGQDEPGPPPGAPGSST